jgi:excinuclease UvrABC nuclease subunit
MMQILNKEEVLNDYKIKKFPRNDLLLNETGLYFLYDINDNLLYIGYSRWIRQRIKSHLNGNTNTKNFYKKIKFIHINYDYNNDCFNHLRVKYNLKEGVDIEVYLINYYKPKYNVRK